MWIRQEGERNDFLPQLLKQESKAQRNIAQLSDSDATWLGRLAVLAELSRSDAVLPPQWQALHRGIEDNNNRYAELNSLD